MLCCHIYESDVLSLMQSNYFLRLQIIHFKPFIPALKAPCTELLQSKNVESSLCSHLKQIVDGGVGLPIEVGEIDVKTVISFRRELVHLFQAQP